MSLDVEHVSRPKVGETQCGDMALVRHSDERTLIAVIDALGHGPQAASTAQIGIAHLQQTALDRSVRSMMESLHAAMQGTRGAAALLGLFYLNRFEGCSVGNVDMRAFGMRMPTVLSPGVVGGTVRKVRVFEANVVAPARFAIFSDGISSRLNLEELKHLTARAACTAVLEKYARPDDDSTVMIVDIG